MRILVPFLPVVLAVACPAPRPPPVIGEGEGEGAGEGEGEGEGEQPAECIQATLGPVTFNFQDDVSTHYQAELITELDGVGPDFLVMQFYNYNERIGDLGVGTFPLDDEINNNYGHCAECLMVFVDQLTPDTAPQRLFFQSGGTLRVEKNPREERDLIGAIEGLVLVESTIGGESLESEPVPGGDCLEIGDVPLDVKFVPAGWTCAPEEFNGGDGVCHCACGVPDDDCFPDFEEPLPTTTLGCEDNQQCTFLGCRDSCDAFGGESCPNVTEVCSFADPSDFCIDGGAIDAAQVGAPCGPDFARFWCAVDATIPHGVCDFDFDGDGVRICRARCTEATVADDCAAGETCLALAGFSDATQRGFCDVQP